MAKTTCHLVVAERYCVPPQALLRDRASSRFLEERRNGRYDLVTGMSAKRRNRMLRPSTGLLRGSTGALLVALLMVLAGLAPALAQDPAQQSAAQEEEP